MIYLILNNWLNIEESIESIAYWSLEGTEGVPRNGHRKLQLAWPCFTLKSLHAQTLMLTDVQTPFLVEQFEATVSQSTIPSPPLILGQRIRGLSLCLGEFHPSKTRAGLGRAPTMSGPWLREKHLSNTTSRTRVFFKSGEYFGRLRCSSTRRKIQRERTMPYQTSSIRQVVPPEWLGAPGASQTPNS